MMRDSTRNTFAENKVIYLPRVKSERMRWLTALAGFFGYGCWAFFVNYGEGLDSSVIAGLTQGSISFALTLCVNLWVEWLYLQLYDIPFSRVLSSLIASVSIIGLSASINLVCGTPNWKMTILPGSIFCTFYVFSYLRFNVKNIQSSRGAI